VVLPDFTPDVALASTSVTRKNLVWGRWNGRDGMGDQERLTLAYAEASNGRDITVGNATYGLFRDGKGAEVVKPENAVVSFALDSAQAYYHSGSGVVAMQVNSGALNINFNERSFATQLGLSHIATGNIDFSAAGRISDTGNFFENTDIQKMAGSVSINGNEAGYFFEKQLGAGNSVQGLTLWDAQ
jgi:predicted house-cleaning NTP pyrophosphatase (Maf/HAM1 superfamily)